MKLYAVSYFNVWPFANTKISIFIKDGKYLIQSPIGRGKSFLFFDGVIYALYGYSKRDILNVECTEWYTKVLFQNDDWEVFFLQRPLTWKKWARLYRFTWKDGETSFSKPDEIIVFNHDFSDNLDMSLYEEIEFHRSTELQQYIDILLPPRSVFLQRHIIMQGEENIFELQAKARIEILKKMFWLDAIDNLRDSLSEIKNNLKWQLKVLQDWGHVVEQYKKTYPLAIDTFSQLTLRFQNQQWYETQLLDVFDWLDPKFFSEMSDIVQILEEYCNDPLVANVDSIHLAICELSVDVFSDYYILLSKKQQSLWQDREMLLLQRQKNREKQKSLVDDSKQLEDRISQVNIELEGYHSNQNVYIDLEKKKTEFESKIKTIHQSITPEIRALILAYTDVAWVDITIQEAITTQQYLLQLWWNKKSELELAKQKIEQYNQQLDHKKKSLEQYKSQLLYIEQSQRDLYIWKLQSEIQWINLQLEQKVASLQMFEQQYNDVLTAIEKLHVSLQYHCDKINAACPFIDAILKKNKLDKDLEILKEKKVSSEKNILEYKTLISNLQKNIIALQNNLQSANRNEFQYSWKDRESINLSIQQIESWAMTQAEKLYQSQCETNILLLEQSLDQIRSDYKIFQSILTQDVLNDFKEYSTSLSKVTQELLTIQKSQQVNAQAMLQKREFETQLKQLTVEQDNLDREYVVLDENLALINNKLRLLSLCSIDNLWNLLPFLTQYLRKLSDLFYEKKRISFEQDLKKWELQSATTLHAIANKELVLYVLQSSLPLLNEYINNLLMKVVPFQLRMQISEDGDELELFVEDQFGLREVKSLSGGQKTVLKLCRVLATSIVFRNSFLFLDETINNVDEEVTAQLADMLLDYMRNYNLTFYTVSHSIQLQSMDIRDDIIVVPSLDMSI